jgi:hypothetical protein
MISVTRLTFYRRQPLWRFIERQSNKIFLKKWSKRFRAEKDLELRQKLELRNRQNIINGNKTPNGKGV